MILKNLYRSERDFIGRLNMLNTDNSKISNSISKGLDFLKARQLPYGEFRTYLFPDKSMNGAGKYVSTTYITTFVLYSLSFIEDERAHEMIEKGIGFLLQEMEGQGVWRFFGTNRSVRLSGGKLVKHTPVNTVPDLDDTACAAYCLKSKGVSIPDNLNVFLENRDESGVFNTWLLGYPKNKEFTESTFYFAPTKNDICCGVLSNILLYLGDRDYTELSSDYLCRVIETGTEEENIPYFPHKHVLYYLLSRAYFGGALSLGRVKGKVIDRISQAYLEENAFKSPLISALTACTCLNFGCFDDMLLKAVDYINSTQKEEGSWPQERFCDEPVRCYGSEELTTAICLEALARYERWNNVEA